MSYTIIWEPNADVSYFEDIDFIFLKWNLKEVQKFQELVFNSIERLALNPTIEIFLKAQNIYSLVVSKQTTLYYKIDSDNLVVYLVLFWNNKKNPQDLMKLL